MSVLDEIQNFGSVQFHEKPKVWKSNKMVSNFIIMFCFLNNFIFEKFHNLKIVYRYDEVGEKLLFFFLRTSRERVEIQVQINLLDCHHYTILIMPYYLVVH